MFVGGSCFFLCREGFTKVAILVPWIIISNSVSVSALTCYPTVDTKVKSGSRALVIGERSLKCGVASGCGSGGS